MRILRNGNWAMDWSNYYGAPAITYYRLSDIVKTLRHYGHTGNESPTTEINPYSDAGYLITNNVTPFRTKR